MPGKSRKPDERAGEANADADALWQRVIADVRPLPGRQTAKPSPARGRGLGEGRAERATRPAPSPPLRGGAPPSPLKERGQNTLDAAWDRRLARGVAAPDLTIDLHGHTLASAHAELDAGLARAVARHARLILLVTGRPPPPGRSRLDNPLRGVIRASIGDWLDQSRHAGRIAAIRNAHPRHGGAGALYLVLRRPRSA